MNEIPAPGQGSIAKGLVLLLALHVGATLLCGLCALLTDGDVTGAATILLFLGGIQVVYVVPAAIVCSTKRKYRTLKGLLIGAGITFLVNAACAGIVLSSIR